MEIRCAPIAAGFITAVEAIAVIDDVGWRRLCRSLKAWHKWGKEERGGAGSYGANPVRRDARRDSWIQVRVLYVAGSLGQTAFHMAKLRNLRHESGLDLSFLVFGSEQAAMGK